MEFDDEIVKILLNRIPDTDLWNQAANSADRETLNAAQRQAQLRGDTFIAESIEPYIIAIIERDNAIASTAIAIAEPQAITDDIAESQPLELTEAESKLVSIAARTHERIGKRKMADAIIKQLTITGLLEIQRVRETKEYKGLIVSDQNGKQVIITCFEQYCLLVEGRSLSAVKNDLDNLKILGAEFIEAMHSIGIGPGTMRSLRAIPADERTELENAAKTANRDEFLELAESLIEKHLAEKQKYTRRAETAEAELSASRQRVEKYRNQVDELETERDKRNAKPPTPNEETERLKLELTRFCEREKRAVSAAIRSFTKQLIEHTDSMGQDQRNFVAGLFCDIEIEFAHLRIDFQIPERPSRDAVPEWMTPKEDAQS